MVRDILCKLILTHILQIKFLALFISKSPANEGNIAPTFPLNI